MLLDRRADVDRCSEIIDRSGATPLFGSAARGHAVVCKMLLKSRAGVNKAGGPEGAGPLHMSIHGGHTEVGKILLDCRAEVDMCCNKGLSPLHLASRQGHTSICDMLLNRRADISKCTNAGQSPLHFSKGHAESCKMLLEKGRERLESDK